MIWRLTYCNKEGVEARIDIIKGNRATVEVVQGSGQPFTLSYKLDKNDKSGHIMTSSADIEIFETETFNVDDLKTSNETELKVEYFEDNVLTWEGFILPDFFSREIGSPNIVRMTASDRLTALKGVTLSDLPSRISLRSLIELCLAETGLSLGLVSQVQINQGSTNILDSEILSQRLTDVRGRSISCYDILMSIMIGTNSTIRQRAGQWQVYNKLEHELRTPTIFFDKVERGAIRTIQPVASSVGVYNEFGGNKMYPENYDFSDGLIGWTAVNGFVAGLNNKEVIGYTGGVSNFVPIYGDTVDTNSVTNRNASFSTSSSPYLKSENIGVSYPDNDSATVTVEVNATGVGSFITNSFVEFAIIATNTVTSKTLSLSNAGIFETMDANAPHLHRIKFPTVTSFYNASTGSLQVEGALIAGDENLGDYDVHVRIYGSGTGTTSFINSTTIKFSVGGDNPKGNLYKTTQGSNFTKQHDVEATVFGDYIRGGLNGYFYHYPIDDTSNLYLPSGELSSPTWRTLFDTTERPLLHHVSRQKSSLFSVAHDILRANINVDSFDPLAVFQDCKGGKYVVVSASFDFLRSEVNVELEQIAEDTTILKRDFIYSYFGEGEDTIKSIGGIAGGGGTGGGGGGGMTNDQVAILNDVAKLAHLHENKEIIDQITQDMVDNASHEIVISTDTETELTDENILSSLRVLLEIAKNNETFLEDLKERFLSKIEPDTAQKLITFIEGIEVGDFTTGALGAGAAVKMIDGTSYAEVDNLTVRQKATFRELIIESLKHIGGQLVLTPARMKCVRVVDGGSFYKCYFDTGDGEVSNEFVAGDFARCQVFTGSGTKFYWRLVTLVGEDWINLSKTSAAVGSDAPEAGDDITQLGNATDTTRQSAIILSTVGIDAPSWKQYSGINSFSLEGKETTVFSKLGNRIYGETVFTSGGANLDDYLDGVAQDILDALQAAQDAEDKAQQAIEDAEADVATINTEIGRLQDQIDGKVSNWYYAYTPTLSNYPASDWTTNEIKDSHIGDTFTNTEPAPAENAGKSWRFIKDGSTYSWIVISDSDALKALQEASKAQATADGKSTTYLFQPTKYKLGDMWVLNDDHTINGTHYKQGDLLTATQDSETFVQSHWLKRVRYTDDTAIDNLEIGGRNYARSFLSGLWRSFEGEGTIDNISQNVSRVYGTKTGGSSLSNCLVIPLRGDTTYTISANVITALNGWFLYREKTNTLNDRSGAAVPQSVQNNASGYAISEGYVEKTFTTSTGTKSIIIEFGSNSVLTDFDVKIEDIVLVKGNKATDWTPAPEDVEASIETAKTEAENAAQAYADTKSEAERVIAEAYADGKVSAEEQARIDDVNDKLAAAKAYAEAQDALLKTQQEAYADGAISTAEQAAIDAAKDYADLKKTEAQAYADGIVSDEEARAIADALDKYNASKAHAEQLVKDIEIGGRNLWTNSRTAPATVTIGQFGYLSGTKNISELGLKTGELITFSVYVSNIPAGESVYARIDFLRPDGTSTAVTNTQYSISNEGVIYVSTFMRDTSEFDRIRYRVRSVSYTANYQVDVVHEKLERGNKATDWSPAPEDVEANIATAKTEAENAAKDYADIQAEAERIKAEAYADGIVSDEEQARIDDVNDKLAAAKAYAEAQDALLKTQQEAYADGAISTAEQAAIDAAKDYADLKKTEAQAYADGIVSDEEARAIADALDKYNASKAHAETLVDNLEIGGRNLLLNTSLEQESESSNPSTNNIQFLFTEPLKIGEYIISFYARTTTGTDTFYISARNGGSNVSTKVTSSVIGAVPEEYSYYEFKLNISTSDEIADRFTFTNRVQNNANNTGTLYVKRAKLEKGNKATDWSPAPEDTERELLESQGYMKARYIRDYLNGSSADARNYWVQIKALDKAGTNIALNKTVTSNIDTINLARITNGDMDVENFARTSGGNQYVQIDLGQVYYDIDNINVYHYWADGRTFYGTKTQISEDGITWKTIFDSAVSGTYKETSGGKVHTTKLTDLVENDQARINEILSDNVADPSEKQYLSNLWQEIYAEYPRIWAQANAYSISKTTYEQKYTALKNILDPILANLTINSTVSGSSIRTAFSQYYDARTALQNAITNKVNTSAGDALAKANTAAAITDLFSGFNGGLATAVIMEMREPSTTTRGDATAGISGIQGAAKDEPAIWAGGTYNQAIGGTAKAIIRHDGTAKFTEAEITGEINATSGSFTGGYIGGMHIAGDTIVSENGRLVIDGTNNTIYLLDDSGAIKTVIRPNDIPTSVSSYFSGSLNQNVSFLGIKGTVFGAATQDSNTIALSGNAYEVTIPPLTLAASSTYTGSGVGSAILTLKLVLSNGGSANDIPVAQVMAISTSVEGYDQVVLPETKKMITKSGTWRLRLISITESVGGGTTSYNGSLTSSATTFNVSEIVNRSEIGSNGMMVATSANNYNFMVGGTFEVRRGNGGLRITNSGIQKWNGSSWVTANI